MNENDKEIIDSTNDTDETVNDEALEVEIDESDDNADDVEALKKQIATLHAQKDHWKKKATDKKEATTVKKEDTPLTLSVKDQLAILKPDLAQEDIDEVVEYATYKKISIREALNAPLVKKQLAENEEFRKSNKASATNNKRPAGRVTDESLVQNASQGKYPESSEEIERLFLARKGIK